MIILFNLLSSNLIKWDEVSLVISFYVPNKVPLYPYILVFGLSFCVSPLRGRSNLNQKLEFDSVKLIKDGHRPPDNLSL